MAEVKEEICQGKGKGLLLPIFGESENSWPNGLRVFLYLFGLLYFFLGVAVVSDIFMGAIEKVTSKKVRKFDKALGRHTTVKVWNDTVANLTLMALGSSAPEILLNVIFIFADGFFQEGLGPSTIVGSAAFNLFIISAVCVLAIPTGEVRRIKEMPVYAVTAFFSVFAYLWLLFILMVSSPNILEVWEGLTTFLFFPLMVVLAYAADRGHFSAICAGATRSKDKDKIVVSMDMSKEDLAILEAKIRQEHGPHISEQQVMKFIEHEHQAPKTRAQYRVGAIREFTGGKKLDVTRSEESALYNIMPTNGNTHDDRVEVISKTVYPIVEFAASQYTVLESKKVVRIHVIRKGDLKSTATVNYRTKDGTASAPGDYEEKKGSLQWKPEEVMQTIEVRIVDDSGCEDDESFYVMLEPNPASPDTRIGTKETAKVVIIDDDEPGVLKFEQEVVQATECASDVDCAITVKRASGGSGKVTCEYRTEEDSAIENSDYIPVSGTLEFADGQMSAAIFVQIKARGRYDSEEKFRVIIEKVKGGAKFDDKTDGGSDCCICYVQISANEMARERVDKIMSNLKVNWDKASVGQNNWKQQFTSLMYVNGGDDDGEDNPPTALDYVMHGLNLPFKLLCAAIPPPDFCDGWLCFCVTLMVIGLITAVIGDMASLLGCCMFGPGNDGITAITFVALGTSLPDTFASKAAALGDPFADASIGNVTGSNSVNVFLGLGLPWMIASIYWSAAGSNEKWRTQFSSKPWIKGFEGGALVVEDPSLANSVAVFTVCALVCMSTFYVRREKCGGELGGPTVSKYATAVFFIFLWFTFIVCYIIMA